MVVFNNKFNSEVTKALNKNAFKKMWWFFVLMSALFIFIGVVSIVLCEDDSDLVYGIVMLVFGICFTPLTFVLTHFIQKSVDNSMSVMSDETEAVYIFDENKVKITQKKGDEFYSVVEATYNYLYKVIESADNYFLYISKLQSHVIMKSGLTEGSLQELNSYFVKNLGNKFKYKK